VVEQAPVSNPVPKVRTGLFDYVIEEPETPSAPETTPSAPEPTLPKTVPAQGWIGRLLTSEAYKIQKDLIRRHAPEDDVVRRCLETLDDNGGIMTPHPAAAQRGRVRNPDA
jgi:hypothetical protein